MSPPSRCASPATSGKEPDVKRISVDIGGTFTDCFVAWEDRYIQAKALTTHHNLAQGFNEALDQACSTLAVQRADVLAQVDSVRYATTLGTNALIERRGPQVGAIVTAGFEATIPLSRGRGYGEGLDELAKNDMSSGTRPDPLVPQTLIRSVRERVDYSGAVLMDLSPEDVRQALRALVDAGAEALVVCLTNATENPAHELRVQEIFLSEYPAHQLGAIPMLLSHQLSGRKGEYVRATSAIVDGFLHATMYHALSELEQNLREHGYPRPMLIIHNSGGMAQLNSTDALQTIHSGPVAGISASEHLAGQAGLGNVVATDMGGTSYDIGLVPADGVKHYDFMPVIDRWLVSVPMIHLVTLGAGGGSIASYDRLHQSVKVGPRSAGSDPGPACYDRGGLRPTVTDADLLLGYLTPERYAGGQIKLNRARAEFAVDEEFGDHLDLDPVEVARLIKAEVDEQMANGLAKELRIAVTCRPSSPCSPTAATARCTAAGSRPTSAWTRSWPRRTARCSPPWARATCRSSTSTSARFRWCCSTPPAGRCSPTSAASTRSWPTSRARAAPTCSGRACRAPRSGTGSSWTCATATSW